MASSRPARAEADCQRHAEAAYPDECCGLVVSTPDGWAVRRAANLSATPSRAFEMDPAVLIKARRAGERIVALYHSHPDQPAVLSAQDRAALYVDGQAAWPGVEIWVISCYRGVADPPCRYRIDTVPSAVDAHEPEP